MGQRNTEDLPDFGPVSEEEANQVKKISPDGPDINVSKESESTLSGESEMSQETIKVHYPRPVYISQILPDISSWSGFNFVMDPTLNRKIQIFAPRKICVNDAFQIFVASLETTGLRALRIDSQLIKIVRGSLGERQA